MQSREQVDANLLPGVAESLWLFMPIDRYEHGVEKAEK